MSLRIRRDGIDMRTMATQAQRGWASSGVGKFWSSKGLNHLIELETARRNGDWDEIWY
jgi:hypothetical protein